METREETWEEAGIIWGFTLVACVLIFVTMWAFV